MRIRSNKEWASVKVRLDVEGGPVLKQRHSRSNMLYQVETITIEYSLIEGEWEIHNAYGVSLTGPVLKKDGTRSSVSHSGHPDNLVPGDGWDWLMDIIDHHRPLYHIGCS